MTRVFKLNPISMKTEEWVKELNDVSDVNNSKTKAEQDALKSRFEKEQHVENALKKNKNKADARLKALVYQGMKHGKNVNQVWKESFKPSETAIRSKMYRIEKNLKALGAKPKPPTAEPVKPSGQAFSPKFQDLPDAPVSSVATVLPPEQPSTSDFVTEEIAGSIVFDLPNSIFQMIDPRLSIPEALKEQGAKIHAVVLNETNSPINKYLPYLACFSYWITLGVVVGKQWYELRKQDQLKKKAKKQKIGKVEKEIVKEIQDKSGIKVAQAIDFDKYNDEKY